MALVAVPAHRIQSIHGAFGAPTFASLSGVGSYSHGHNHGGAAHLQASFNAQPNVSSPRARAAPLSILAARTAAASASYSASAQQAPPTPVTRRQRRPSFRSIPIPTCTPSTPLARTAAASQASSTAPVPTPKMLTLTYSTYAYPAVATPRFQDANRTSKLVANVLLNRANGCPRRRQIPLPGAERPYVPSCLSRVVEVEC